MPKLRAEIHIDGDQSPRRVRLQECPNCHQKLLDVEHLQGIAVLRIKCRRCGKYIKAELVGVE